MKERPKIGIHVIIIRENKVLLGKRKDYGCWGLPAGHLEFNETIEECAIRETLEETGITIKNIKLGPYTNDIEKEKNLHYVNIFVIPEFNEGIVKNLEPDKCEKWEWFEWNNLPSPLFNPIENLLKQNFNPLKKLIN
jgi:8-oxo-dGTP diphosphatase